MSNLRHWLWLSTRGPAPGMYAARLLEHFGTPEGAYFASEAAYDQVPDLPSKVRRALLDKDLTGADRILAQCDALDIRILTCQDAAYPQRLAQLDTAPCVLYVRGKLPQIRPGGRRGRGGGQKGQPLRRDGRGTHGPGPGKAWGRGGQRQRLWHRRCGPAGCLAGRRTGRLRPGQRHRRGLSARTPGPL